MRSCAIGLKRGDEHYVVTVYDEASRLHAIRTIGSWFECPDLEFDAEDLGNLLSQLHDIKGAFLAGDKLDIKLYDTDNFQPFIGWPFHVLVISLGFTFSWLAMRILI